VANGSGAFRSDWPRIIAGNDLLTTAASPLAMVLELPSGKRAVPDVPVDQQSQRGGEQQAPGLTCPVS
jgi:hypothetical protein